MEGAKVLDLYCGSSALGIEALSRGATHVTFVDRSFYCMEAVQKSLRELGADASRWELVRAEAMTALRKFRRNEEPFDLVLLDPPYGHELARKMLIALNQYAIVSLAGIVVAEHDKREHLPPRLDHDADAAMVLKRQERYGDTVLTFFERQ